MTEEPTPYVYDPADFAKPKRGKSALTPEWKIQAACVTYYRKRCRVDAHLRDNTRLFASMNEGQRTPQRAAVAKMMGMVPGAPWDLTLMEKAGGRGYMPEFQVHWIEIKREGGKLSAAQVTWEIWLRGTPIRCHVVKSVDDFIAILENRA